MISFSRHTLGVWLYRWIRTSNYHSTLMTSSQTIAVETSTSFRLTCEWPVDRRHSVCTHFIIAFYQLFDCWIQICNLGRSLPLDARSKSRPVRHHFRWIGFRKNWSVQLIYYFLFVKAGCQDNSYCCLQRRARWLCSTWQLCQEKAKTSIELKSSCCNRTPSSKVRRDTPILSAFTSAQITGSTIQSYLFHRPHKHSRVRMQ